MNPGISLEQAVIEQSESRRYLCLTILYQASTMQWGYAMWLRWGGGLMQGSSTLPPTYKATLERTGYLSKGTTCASNSGRVIHNGAICQWGFRPPRYIVMCLISSLHVLGWFFSAFFKWANIVWFIQEVRALGLNHQLVPTTAICL